MLRRAAFLLVGLALAASAAAPFAAEARKEIDALLARLESSGCAFNRNGGWHTAAEAKAHLLRKLKHVDEKAPVQSAEQFIEQIGSSSSTTGTPYLVRCGNETPVPSSAWLLAQLRAMRSSATGKSAP